MKEVIKNSLRIVKCEFLLDIKELVPWMSVEFQMEEKSNSI